MTITRNNSFKITRAMSGLAMFGLAASAACNAQTIDLGANKVEVVETPDAAPDLADGSQLFYGCSGAVSDSEVDAIRGGGCVSSRCTKAAGDELHRIVTLNDVVAVTRGRWFFCDNTVISPIGTGGPLERVVGIEFSPGCITNALLLDKAGAVVRGTEAGDQGNYDIVMTRGKQPQIDLHIFDGRDVRLDIESGKCPNNWMTLTSKEGRRMTMHAIPPNQGDAGRPAM
jgi:hypothetical protein